MSVNIPQTTFSIEPPVAIAGMLADGDADNFTGRTVIADEAITPGAALGLVSSTGNVLHVRNLQHSDKFVGVALYESSAPPGGYAVNDALVAVRRGRIYAKWSGTTQAWGVAPNIKASTTTVANAGVFTDAATATTAGSEVDAVTGVLLESPAAITGVCLVELNLVP